MNFKFRRRSIGVLPLALCAIGCTTPASPPGPALTIDACVFLDAEGGNPKIQARIQNNSNFPIEIYKWKLPWGATSSTKLFMFSDSRNFKPIEETFYPDDPSPDTLKIQPGTSVKGEIELARRFPKIDLLIQEGPIVIYFKYEFKNVDATIVAETKNFFIASSSGNGDLGRCQGR